MLIPGRFCQNCGSRLEYGEIGCSNCGAAFDPYPPVNRKKRLLIVLGFFLACGFAAWYGQRHPGAQRSSGTGSAAASR